MSDQLISQDSTAREVSQIWGRIEKLVKFFAVLGIILNSNFFELLVQIVISQRYSDVERALRQLLCVYQHFSVFRIFVANLQLSEELAVHVV